MCGRYNNHLTKMIGWAERLKEWPTVKHSYNVTPTTQVAAFRSTAGESMRWGMIPSWSKSFDSKYATFNARVETVAEKPTFRNAWNNSQRCLIPMAGYYTQFISHNGQLKRGRPLQKKYYNLACIILNTKVVYNHSPPQNCAD